MSLDVFTHKGFKLTGTALNIAPDSPVFARWAGPVLDKAGLLAAPARDHAAKADRRRLPGLWGAPAGAMSARRFRRAALA